MSVRFQLMLAPILPRPISVLASPSSARQVAHFVSGGSLSTAATAAQVLTGTEFFNAAGTKSTGTMSNHGAITYPAPPSLMVLDIFSSITLSPGADFAATNICSSKSILGTAGSALCTSGGSLSAAATAAQVLTGTEFFNATGVKSTGTMSNQGTWNVTSSFPGAGYVAAISNAPAAGNICSGTQVHWYGGYRRLSGAAGSGTLALTYALCSGYYGYNSSGTALDGSKTCNDVGTPSTISGLKLWYRADSIANKANAATMEAARDQSSYSNDANVTGTVTYYTGIIGTKPASKSSANGYINYPHATQLDLEHSDPFSIVLAMRTGSAFNAWEWIVNKQQASGEYNGWYFFTGSSNTQKLGFCIRADGRKRCKLRVSCQQHDGIDHPLTTSRSSPMRARAPQDSRCTLTARRKPWSASPTVARQVRSRRVSPLKSVTGETAFHSRVMSAKS